MLHRSLRSLDELNALKERERFEASVVDARLPTPESSALIDYFDYPLNPSLVAALVAFDPTNPY